MLSIDLRKAFDTLDHNILLKKLYFFGIRGLLFYIFKSYLSNRMQYVIHNGIRYTMVLSIIYTLNKIQMEF